MRSLARTSKCISGDVKAVPFSAGTAETNGISVFRIRLFAAAIRCLQPFVFFFFFFFFFFSFLYNCAYLG